MRIIYFSQDYGPHDHRFLTVLAESEHEVYFLRLARGLRQTEDRPVPSRINQVQWEGGQGPFAWRDLPRLLAGLRGVLRRLKPDLVHAGPIQTCGLLAALTGFRPLLVMSWGFDLMQDAERGPGWRWATRYVLRRASAFTGDCEVTRRKAVAFGVPAEQTVVFPWGVDLEHFSPPAARRSPSEAFTVFCNRSWEPRYGVDVLAAAFVRAARECPDLRLMLLGGGSQGARIRQILEQGDVGGRVAYLGQVSQADLPRCYHMADLYVSPSHVDGSSVSLMEALACGLPCLVSDIPANQEWIGEAHNGWLFPDGDVEALAAAILRIQRDRMRLAGVRRAARLTAEQRADWKKNSRKLLEAYDLALRAER